MKQKSLFKRIGSSMLAVAVSLTTMSALTVPASAGPNDPPPPPVSNATLKVLDDPANVSKAKQHKYTVELKLDTANVEILIPDVALVLDVSGSMDQGVPEAGGVKRIELQRQAANQFVNSLFSAANPEAGRTILSGTRIGSIDASTPFNNNLFAWSSSASTPISSINTTVSDYNYNTYYSEALKEVQKKFDEPTAASRPASDYQKVVVWMTDGEPNGSNDGNIYNQVDTLKNSASVKIPGMPAGKDSALIFHTVGMGISNPATNNILQTMSSRGNGISFPCISFNDVGPVLQDIFTRAMTIARRTEFDFTVSNDFKIIPNTVKLTNTKGVETPLTTGITLDASQKSIKIENFPLLPNGTSYVRFDIECLDSAAPHAPQIDVGSGTFQYDRATNYVHPFASPNLANHNKHTYIVNYTADANGSVNPTNATVAHGDAPVEPIKTGNPGWAFDHWEESGNSVNLAVQSITSSRTFKAIFARKTANMEYLPGDGSITGTTIYPATYAAPIPVPDASMIITPPAGKAFDQWLDINGNPAVPGTTLVDDPTLKLTATYDTDINNDKIPDKYQFKYELTFKAQGETIFSGGSLAGKTQFDYLVGDNRPTSANPTNTPPESVRLDKAVGFAIPTKNPDTDNQFLKWVLADGTTVITEGNMPAYQINGDYTITGVFTAKTYSVTFNSRTNNLASSTITTYGSPKKATFEQGLINSTPPYSTITAIQAQARNLFTNPRFKFQGWRSSIDNKVYTSAQVASMKSTGAAVVFTAVFIPGSER